MSLKDFSREEIENLSMLELASIILKEEKKALDFQELFSRIAELKEFTKEQKEDFIAQFYTDLNVDGRFTTLGSNMWGLKRWYPIEQADEEVHTPKKKKKSAKKKQVDEFEDEDILDEEDLDEEFDDEEFEEDIDVDDDEDLEKEDELDEDIDKELEEFDDDFEEEEIDEEFDDDEFDDEKDEEDN